ncbi:hypothetical protein KJI95_09980 [Shewanella sp. JM162201]|uniref:Uncharacterized protein n=1 Tax=Shewanella jiangmenensis TaxID=2837387 RepID=A0ABS5V321_9GAMM|nr:hypothetical protein [Shewanella jiangmenensis]MBT1444850.1 hypothetical protein [Shewanella jiangmenensis]
MGVIHALGSQWHKAEFAALLGQTLMQRPAVSGLFQGATSMSTVCNLMAAISYRSDDPRFTAAEIDDPFLLLICFDCFRLLFVKEVQQGGLSQAEQLILTLCRRVAAQVAADVEADVKADVRADLEVGVETAAAPDTLNDATRLMRAQIQRLGTTLDELYLERRRRSNNMLGG